MGPIRAQKRPIFEKRPNVPSKNENDVVLIGAVASIAGWHMKAEINRNILCFDNILIPSLSLKKNCVSKTSNRRKSKIENLHFLGGFRPSDELDHKPWTITASEASKDGAWGEAPTRGAKGL